MTFESSFLFLCHSHFIISIIFHIITYEYTQLRHLIYRMFNLLMLKQIYRTFSFPKISSHLKLFTHMFFLQWNQLLRKINPCLCINVCCGFDSCLYMCPLASLRLVNHFLPKDFCSMNSLYFNIQLKNMLHILPNDFIWSFLIFIRKGGYLYHWNVYILERQWIYKFLTTNCLSVLI